MCSCLQWVENSQLPAYGLPNRRSVYPTSTPMRTLRPPGGNGVDEPDGAWQAGIGSLLARVGGFEGAPPDDELFDERARRNLLRGETGKFLQSKAVLDIRQAGKNVIAIRPEIDWPIRGMLDHALFAEFRDMGFHRERPVACRT